VFRIIGSVLLCRAPKKITGGCLTAPGEKKSRQYDGWGGVEQSTVRVSATVNEIKANSKDKNGKKEKSITTVPT